MASAETKQEMCLVCLDAPAVRQVDTCQHVYCENCLSSPNFACPQCVTKGSRIHGAGCYEDGKPHAGQGTQETKAGDTTSSALVHANCKLCHYKGKTVKAVNKCRDCKSIPLCVDCSQAHRKSKATEKHVVVSLASVIKREEVLCNEHGELIEHFCKSCFKTLCHICVSLSHSDHAVDTFNNVVAVEVEKVRAALEHQERRLNMFKSDEKELRQSKTTIHEMEDALIKSVEDHAEKCIEKILKSKEALKKQIRSDFEVGIVLGKRLAAMAELQRMVAAEANQLLNEHVKLHARYVQKLVGLKEELAKLKEGQPDYEEDKAKYQQAFNGLLNKFITFYPRTPNCKIGGFENPGLRCTDGGPCVCDMCEKVFKWPNSARVKECRLKGACTCGTCESVSKWPKAAREGECRQNGECTCRTCECRFIRSELKGYGYCVTCNSRIAVGYDFTFP